jgi:hypothetical protein
MTDVTRRLRPSTLSPSQVRLALLTLACLGTGALGAWLSEAAPTGIRGVDEFWTGGLVAAVAYLSGTARRWSWFIPAGVAAALSGGNWATGIAAIAILLTFWCVFTDTRTRARGALIGGLGAAALMGAGDVGFHGATAVATALAVLPAAVTGYRYAHPRSQAHVRLVAGTLGGACLLVTIGATLGIVSTQRDLTEGARLIDQGLDAVREADDDLAGERLSQAARHLTSADVTLTSWFVEPARLLPAIGPNLDAVESLADESANVAAVASEAAETADIDTLRFLNGRIDTEAIAGMEEPLEDSLAAVQSLDATLDDVALSPWLVAPIADRLDSLGGQVGEALPDGEAALSAIRNAPNILGTDQPRRYLVLFTTPVEARGRSGFPGNYAELVVDNGALSMPVFGRITDLEQAGVPGDQRQITEPPEYVARYSRFDPAWTWRNITMSPDFPSVATAARDLYPQSGGQPIDGVMAVDPEGLAALLRWTGPVDVPGLPNPLDTDNAADFLLFDQYIEFPDRADRVDVLETVARTTFERLTTVNLPSPRAVAEELDPIVDGGHIQFTTFDVDTFLWLDTFGLAGRLGDAAGDALAVTTSNAGGSKIDLFLERRVRYDATWDPATGQVVGTITLAMTNGSPASGLPEYVIGNTVGLPLGTNRSFLSVYSTLDLAAARVNGQPAAFSSERELGRNVWSTFVDIPPGATTLVELDVQGTVLGGGAYILDLAQQPLAIPEQAEVNITVAGDLPIGAAINPIDLLEPDGRTVTWAGPLDQRLTMFINASPDAEEIVRAEREARSGRGRTED